MNTTRDLFAAAALLVAFTAAGDGPAALQPAVQQPAPAVQQPAAQQPAPAVQQPAPAQANPAPPVKRRDPFFKSAAVARKTFEKRPNGTFVANATSRGETYSYFMEHLTPRFDARTGAHVGYDITTTQYSLTHAGITFAYPRDEFEIAQNFTYRDLNGIRKSGVLVYVDIYVSCTGDISAEENFRAVKNYVDGGVCVPKEVGRPGKLMSLKASAKKRFAASQVIPLYGDSGDSKLGLLVMGCNKDKANEKITPFIYEGELR